MPLALAALSAAAAAAAAAAAPPFTLAAAAAAAPPPIALASWRLHGQLLGLRLPLLGYCLGGYKL